MARGFTHESAYNESKEWYTPRDIFRGLGIDFDLDPCSPGNAIVPWIPVQHHISITDFPDGLASRWKGRVWMNPPYGADTPKWMKKLAQHGNGIALVFARTDTAWFHQYASKADAVCFIAGRISFIPADKSLLYADGLYAPKGGCGAASMLLGYGVDCASAVMGCGLGLSLPVSRFCETRRVGNPSGVSSRFARACWPDPHENSPAITEPGRDFVINNS